MIILQAVRSSLPCLHFAHNLPAQNLKIAHHFDIERVRCKHLKHRLCFLVILRHLTISQEQFASFLVEDVTFAEVFADDDLCRGTMYVRQIVDRLQVERDVRIWSINDHFGRFHRM